MLNHKSFLFKISKSDIGSFWSQDFKDKERKNVHNFLWLNLIDRKTDFKLVQQILKNWIDKYGNYKKDIWNENIVGKRIIAWISNGEMILSNKRKDFENIFFNL